MERDGSGGGAGGQPGLRGTKREKGLSKERRKTLTSSCPRMVPRLGLPLAPPWEGKEIEGTARDRTLVHSPP